MQGQGIDGVKRELFRLHALLNGYQGPNQIFIV